MKPTDAPQIAVSVTYRVPFPASENPQLWITAKPVFIAQDTVERIPEWQGRPEERALAGLTFTVTVFAQDGWLLPRVEYLNRGDLDRHQLKLMLHCIERIERHMERQAAKNGTPESAGEYLQHFARALGTPVVIREGDAPWRHADLAQARYEVNSRVFEHRRQYGPAAAPPTRAEVASEPTPDCCSVLHPCDSMGTAWPRLRA